MRGFIVGAAIAMFVATGCLVNPKSSGKKLHTVHGRKVSTKQLRENMEKSIDIAKSIVHDTCGAVLHKGKWNDTENGEGFFVYQTKRKGLFSGGIKCNMQYVTMNLQATYHIGRHGLSCEISREGRWHINVPSRDNKNEAIKITCNAHLVDLHLSDKGMRITTFAENGNTYTAIVDQAGYLKHIAGNVVAGVSTQKAAQLSSKITEAKIAKVLAENPNKLMIVDSGTAITGALAGIIASEAVAMETSNSTGIVLLNTISAAKSFVPAPVGLILALRTFIWSQSQASKDYNQTVPVLRALLQAHLKSTATQYNQGDMQ